MKYSVIKKDDLEELIDMVESFLDDGWEAQGGVSIAYERTCITYAQAMIKRR